MVPPDRVLQSEAQLLNSRDPARSLVVLQTLADRAAAAGSQHVEAWALWMRAFAAFWSEPRTSLEPSLHAVEVCRTYGQPTAIAASLGALALAYSVSDPRRALELSTEACSVATAAGSTWVAAQSQLLLGSVQAGLAKGESGEVLNRTIDHWVDNLARSGNLSMRWRMLSNVAPLVLTRSPADFAVAVGIFRSRQVGPSGVGPFGRARASAAGSGRVRASRRAWPSTQRCRSDRASPRGYIVFQRRFRVISGGRSNLRRAP